jgi:hypothetical protein
MRTAIFRALVLAWLVVWTAGIGAEETDPESGAEETETAEAAEAAAADAERDEPAGELPDELRGGASDEFIPSEQISADQDVAFPTDI